jgi:hypothetical protein
VTNNPFNRYAYTQNDQINFVDPMGLCPEGTVEQADALGNMQCGGVGTNSVTINISGAALSQISYPYKGNDRLLNPFDS